MGFRTAVFATSLLLSTSAFANFTEFLQDFGDRGSPVLTLHMITPDNKNVPGQSGKLLAGTSATDPCSDMVVVFTHNASFVLRPGNFNFSSSSLKTWFGENATCVAAEVMYRDNLYQTGNILLSKNSITKDFVAAQPNYVEMDFTEL